MGQDRQPGAPAPSTLSFVHMDPQFLREQVRQALANATPEEVAGLDPELRQFAIQQGALPLPRRPASGSLLQMLAQPPSVTAETPEPMRPVASHGPAAAPEPDWGQQAVSTGLRTVPGVVGSAFGPVGGFLGGAGGELGAQVYEGRPINWTRVAVAGGLNMMPGLGAGRQLTRLGLTEAAPVASALAENGVSRVVRGALGGALTAPVSTATNNWADGRPLGDQMLANIGMGAALGTGVGGLLEGGRAAAPAVARGVQQAGDTIADLLARHPELSARLADETGAVGDLGTRAAQAQRQAALKAERLGNAPVGIEQGQFVMSNRVPNTPQPPGIPLATNLEVVRAHPDLEARMADAVRLSPLVTAKQARLSPRGVTDAFVEVARENLQALVRQMNLHAEGARQWYDGAHAIARALSGEDFTTNQTSGVLAVMSPQKDWHQNAELGRQIVEGYRLARRDDLPFSRELFQRFANSATLSFEESIKDKLRKGTLDAAQAAEARLEKQAQIAEIGTFAGRAFSTLPLRVKSRMLRALGEQEFGTTFPIVAPDGSLGDLMRNKGKSGQLGDPSKLGWNAYNMVEKAIAILEDGSAENIGRQLGSEHKVRAFYNNINAPWSPLASTVDTHQVAASHLQPMAQSHPAVNMSMGGVSHAEAGVSGTNPLYQEALRQEAAAMGWLPREVQSVTWEGLKGLWSPDDKRNAATGKTVAKLWNEYRQGRRSLEQTQQDILGLVQFTPPVWAPR